VTVETDFARRLPESNNKTPEERRPEQAAVTCGGLWKTFRMPVDRPYTLKQRVIHPRRSRAAATLHALRDVTFQIAPGEFFGVIGRNGSGKSTLLKCLAGVYRPTRGELAVAGRVSPFIELGVGFNTELTAFDNVMVNASLLGIPPREARASFDEIIRFAELEDFVELKLKNYSSGMYVRLGFAAAIQAKTDVLLVDEVLAVGDMRFQQKCFDTFRRFKREGRTVVFVTHDLAAIERFCDRALLLEAGEAIAIGDPEEIIHIYRQHDLGTRRSDIDAESKPRWGDGAAEIVAAWFEDDYGQRRSVLTQAEPATFRARVRFAQTLVNPIFGVILENERGHHVFVTNTMFDRIATGVIAAGTEVIYSVRLVVQLADGAYSASPAVAYEDAFQFADWRERLVDFEVRAERPTGGIADFVHETSLDHIPTRHAVEDGVKGRLE